MNNFKIGDLLVGTETNPYGITNQWAVVKVLSITAIGDLYVKIIEPRPSAPEYIKQLFESDRWVGFEDYVKSEYFELYNDKYYYNPELNKFGYFEGEVGLICV